MKISHLFFAASMIALSGCTDSSQIPETAHFIQKIAAVRMSPAATQADIALTRQTLETLHAGYGRYTPIGEMDALWAGLSEKSTQGLSREELYLEVSRILAAIKCSHTKAQLPADLAAQRKTDRIYLPFRFVLIKGQMFVDTPGDTPLIRGEEILAIDDIDVADWIVAIEPFVPVDGDAQHVKPLVMAYTTEFMGGALDHFAPLMRTLDKDVTIVSKSAKGTKSTHRLERLSYTQYLDITGEVRFGAGFKDGIRFETLGDTGAYLAVDTFINYRDPVDPTAALEPYFAQLKSEGRTKLIVDIRNNGGGSTDAQSALLSYLIDRPVQQADAVWTRFDQIDPAIRQSLDTWEKAALDPDPGWFINLENGFYKLAFREAGAPGGPTQPADQAFTGELVVLIGPNNSSGSTHLAAILKANGYGTFVGSRTGGTPTGATAGVLYTLTLPESGIKLLIPAQRTMIANADKLPKRNGLPPNIEVPLSYENYFLGTDATLQAAKSHLGLAPK